MAKNMIPKIRFRSFSEPWVDLPIKNACDFGSGYGYTKGDLRSSGTPIILYGRLYTKYETEINDVDTFAERIPNSVVSSGGEVIMPSSGETAEDIAVASVIAKNGIIIGGGLHILRPKEGLLPYHLATSITYGRLHDKLSKLAQGKSVVHLYKDNVATQLISTPSVYEQESIRNLFVNLDSVLSSKKTELEKLENVKKACMERMFPRKGETKPQLRFKGFDDEWKIYKLEDIGFMTAGGTPSTFVEEYWNGDINWLQSGAIQNCMIYDNAIEKRITQKGLLNSSTHLIKKDSVLIAITGATCANVGYLTFCSCANQSVVSIEPTPLHNSMFIYQILLTKRKNILAMRGGSAQGGVSLGSLKTIEVSVPTLAEQEKIGNYFRHMDELIAAKRQEIEKLQNIKQSLLDKMFV